MLQQDIIDNISSGVIGLDEQYRVRLINPAAEAHLQLSEARILGQTLFDVESEELSWRASLEQAANESRTIVIRSVNLDHRDGRRALVDLFVTPLHNVPGLNFLIELQPVDRLMRISREENQLSAQEATRSVVKAAEASTVKGPEPLEGAQLEQHKTESGEVEGHQGI